MSQSQSLDLSALLNIVASTLKTLVPENATAEDLRAEGIRQLITSVKKDLTANILIGTATIDVSKFNKSIVTGAIDQMLKDGLTVDDLGNGSLKISL